MLITYRLAQPQYYLHQRVEYTCRIALTYDLEEVLPHLDSLRLVFLLQLTVFVQHPYGSYMFKYGCCYQRFTFGVLLKISHIFIAKA